MTKDPFLESKLHQTLHWKNSNDHQTVDMHLLSEEPLSIRIQGKPYTVVMRTPGDEIAHAAGLCLGEGIVDSPEDFATLAACEEETTHVVTVTLKPPRDEMVDTLVHRRAYISQTSCGICGKQIISDLLQDIPPLQDQIVLDISETVSHLDALSRIQPLRQTTLAAHAAALFNADFKLLSLAEDVGRHNALDKAVGKLFLDGSLHEAAFMILSSRLSYELVQKAGRAKIPVILSKSRPTSLAVSLAKELNLTVACASKETGILVFCGKHRLKGCP
jgi:FdhD protein